MADRIEGLELGQLFEGEALRTVFDRIVSLAIKRKVSGGRRARELGGNYVPSDML